MQAVHVTFQNSTANELTASDNRIRQIARTSSADVYSVNQEHHAIRNDIANLCNNLTLYIQIHYSRRRYKPPKNAYHETDISLDHGKQDVFRLAPLREIRQLDYISQLLSDLQHISGSNNLVADIFSYDFLDHFARSQFSRTR